MLARQSKPGPLVSKPERKNNLRNEARRMYSLAIIKGIEKEKPRKVLVFGGFGAPKGIRTSGLPLRRRSLYPAEL